MKAGHKEEYYELQDQRFLGAKGFGETLQEEEEPALRKRKAIEAVIKTLARKAKVGETELRSADRSWKLSKLRTMIAYVMVRRPGYGLKEVATYLKRDPATVGALLERMAVWMENDGEIRKAIDSLDKIV